MGTTLTGQTQSSTYDALLKITDNGPVGGALKTVTDGLGNDTALQISTAGISVNGTLVVTAGTTLAALAASGTTVSSLVSSGIVSSTSAQSDAININAAAATTRAFAVKTASLLRWYWGANGTAEGGSNAGSDFFLASANDAGAFLALPIVVTRSTGKVVMTAGIENSPIGATTPSTIAATTFTASSTVVSTAATAFGSIFVNAAAATERSFSIKTAGNARWYWGATNTAEGGSNAGSNFQLVACNDAGALLSTPISIVRSTGVVTIADLVVTNGVTDAQGDVRLIPQNSQSGPYTLVLGDKGKHIFHPSADVTARTWTIPANASVAYAIGTPITFINENGAGVITISINSDTMRLAGAGTTGNRTLAANGVATAVKVTSTSWVISGTGLT